MYNSAHGADPSNILPCLYTLAMDRTMTATEIKLLEILKDRSLTFGQFRLASGAESKYYIDGKMTQVFSAGAHLIGEVLYERTKELDFSAIGGLEAGAIPLATAAVISYHLHGREMEGFWVRDKVKDHGTQKLIEGRLQRGSRVVVVDDVITKGTSVVRAIEGVRSIGCEIVQVVSIVDRNCGARELLKQHGVTNYFPVFTIRDLGVEADVAEKPERVTV
jgi:orotate phosphoribosyltransferase